MPVFNGLMVLFVYAEYNEREMHFNSNNITALPLALRDEIYLYR